MTPEELLKPRYKVIADYFFNPYNVGDIITLPENNRSVHLTTTKHTDEFGENVSQAEHYAPKVIEQYPHLFKPLAWWEDRKPEEMPEYVKDKEGTVYKIKTHELDVAGDAFFTTEEDTLGWNYNIIEAQIATEAEYNAYINKQ